MLQCGPVIVTTASYLERGHKYKLLERSLALVQIMLHAQELLGHLLRPRRDQSTDTEALALVHREGRALGEKWVVDHIHAVLAGGLDHAFCVDVWEVDRGKKSALRTALEEAVAHGRGL